MDKKTLEKYMVQLRRVSESRELQAERSIRRIYKRILKDLQEFLGVEYAQLAQDGKLTFEILRKQQEHARFLEEVERRIDGITPSVSAEITAAVEEITELSFRGMVDAVEKLPPVVSAFEEATGFPDVDHREIVQERLKTAFEGLRATIPEVIRATVENPVAGLTLKDTLEKNRKEIIYDIKKQIGVGLSEGDRMDTMARRIAKSLDGDYVKAVRIVRTEAHRVREAGFHAAAEDVQIALDDAEVGAKLTKTWKTMKDERVRPGRGIGKKPAKNPKANHQKMEGITLMVNEEFDLGGGVKAQKPGNSGDASNDINCRCYLSYDLLENKKPQAKPELEPEEKYEYASGRDDLEKEYLGMKTTPEEDHSIYGDGNWMNRQHYVRSASIRSFAPRVTTT